MDKFGIGCVLAVMIVVTNTQSVVSQDGKRVRDVHSFSNPEHIKTTHLDLKLKVDFKKRIIGGQATLTVERTSKNRERPLVLDTKDLTIEKAEYSINGRQFLGTKFEMFPPPKNQRYLGSKLVVQAPPQVQQVRITYTTGRRATALQWLNPKQTSGGKFPFLFTQSQPIYARSWIPLQDSPGVRVTYTATVQVPKDLVAVMSSTNVRKKSPTGVYKFTMRQKIPPYLIALAVGDLQFQSLGKRSGVYAEPSVVNKAAAEFAVTESMLEAIERRFGKYRWERYDILVLPPSFPYGGMENPRLTFVTPTILAGDRSLLALIAHEMAHSWSGNLVSNATWRDFWLNEGFTVYLERRILEDIYGRDRALMNAVLGRRDLDIALSELKPRYRKLYINLAGRNPEEGSTDIPYEKGALFLTHLEKVFGREKFDKFLRSYFEHYAFRSITTPEFVDYLDANLLKKAPKLAVRVPVQQWIEGAKLPESAPRLEAKAFVKVEEVAKLWLQGNIKTSKLPTKQWSTQEWLHFLQVLPADLGKRKMKQLDDAFTLTKVGNSVVLMNWLRIAIRNEYEPAYPRLEKFLTSMGRRWFLRELYKELVKTEAGKQRARRLYAKARATYHPISVASIDEILKWEQTK
ncbi:MAG: M1 family metallopeptidase [Gemmataceae bacterium]